LQNSQELSKDVQPQLMKTSILNQLLPLCTEHGKSLEVDGYILRLSEITRAAEPEPGIFPGAEA